MTPSKEKTRLSIGERIKLMDNVSGDLIGLHLEKLATNIEKESRRLKKSVKDENAQTS